MSRALVISGGGSKGAFAVGVVKRLLQQFPNLEFDIFVGTSTGALIVPLVAMGELALLEKMYTSLHTKDVLLERRLGDALNDHSIFDVTPLEDLVINNFTAQRYAELLATAKPIFLPTVCLNTGEIVVYTTAPNPAAGKYYSVRKLVDADHFQRAVIGSGSQPVFMRPVMVNENVPGEEHRDRQYVDGGVREYAGVEMAIDNGATEIFTILLSSDQPDIQEAEYISLLPILQRTLDIFTDDVAKNDLLIPQQFNEALLYLAAVKDKMKRDGLSAEKIAEYFTISGKENPYEDKVPLKIFIIKPDAPLGGGPGGLTFDPDEMKGMVAKGETASDEFIASLDPGEITWA